MRKINYKKNLKLKLGKMKLKWKKRQNEEKKIIKK